MTDLAEDALNVVQFQQVSGQPLYQMVADQITRQIASGTLEPGFALPIEADLAQQFGVSRTVIREAVRVLVTKGLVTVRQGSGVRVQASDQWNYLDPLILFEQVRGGSAGTLLDEIIEVRRTLEVEAASLAAQRRSTEELAELEVTLQGMERTLAQPESFTKIDIKFHDLIMNAARNRLLREALRPIAETLQFGRHITIGVPGGAEASLQGHQAIFRAIEQQDPVGARTAMLEHVEQFEHDIRFSLSAREDGLVRE